MKFLRANAPRFPLEEFGRIAASAFGLTGTLKPLYSERDQNVLLREANGTGWVLKIGNAEEDPEIIDCQIKALQHIAAIDPSLPVPRVRPALDGSLTLPLCATDGSPHLFYVFSFLEGEIPAKHQVTPNLLNQIGVMLSRLGLALRGFFHPAAGGRELLWDVRMAPALATHAHLLANPEDRRLTEEVVRRLCTDVMPRLARLRAQVIHGDLHEHNLILDGNGTISGLIDFGDMIHGPLVLDIANTAADFLQDPEGILETLRPVVGGYHSVTPLEPEEIDLLFDLICVRLTLVPLINAWRKKETPDEPNYIAGLDGDPMRVIAALHRLGREAVTDFIRETCGLPVQPRSFQPIETLIARRKRLMGAHLYVFYDPPLHMVHGEGVWLTDSSGRRFLDCYNNVPHVGHCHPHVVDALTLQQRTLNTNTRYLGEQVLRYGERLTGTLDGDLTVCAFVNSGSEANDIAWRMARCWTGHRGGLAQEFAYHGITEAIDAFSPSANPRGTIAPHIRTLLAPDGYRGKYRHGTPELGRRYAEDADRAIHSLATAGLKPAAFIVDSAFMTNGVLEPVPDYVAGVFARVRAAGGICIADEVQSGFGRMGTHMWGHQHHGVIPDIVTIGKPAGNGHPLGVVITRPEIYERFISESAFFSTFGGNNVSAAAGLAVLDVIGQEALVSNAASTGAYFKAGMKALMARHDIIGDVRATGLAMGVELVLDRKSLEPATEATRRLLNLLRDEGVLVGSEGVHGNILKVRPPIVFSAEHADIALAAFDRALGNL